MTSPSVASAVLGAQRPRICHIPEYVSSAGDEAVELAAMAGLELDDWQQFVLRHSLGERDDGSWAAPTIALVCPRQNGKNAILEARELAGLFLLGEGVIVHSAHEQATASEQFRRLEGLIKNVPEFERRVARFIKGKGSEAIELRSGQRILFKTRTGGGARGFSIDCIVFDEAYELPETAISAMVPALSARPNTQRWYTSSAVDREKHAYGVALTRQRERGIARKSGVAYFEWSTPGDDPGLVPSAVRSDPEVWAAANPSLGDRIALETVQHECDGEMGAREFAVERLGIGDWPDITEDAGRVIGGDAWAAIACHDESIRPVGKRTFAVDVNPDRTWGSIGVAGRRSDDLWHVAIVEHQRVPARWLVDRCAALAREFPGTRFVVDTRGPASNLIPRFQDLGLDVAMADTSDYGRACADFYDAVETRILRYSFPQPDLDEAVAAACARKLGDRWAWDRRSATGADITPVVACTLALWGARDEGAPSVWNLAEVVGNPVPQQPQTTSQSPGGQRFVPLDQAPVQRGVFRH